MFMGEYNHTIDEKGRVIVPSKFRESLGDVFVVTQGMDGCLLGYPKEEWEKFVQSLQTLPISKDARKLQRYFMAGAVECETDKQGRILISSKLRQAAALEKDVVFVGVLNKIEIWSKERWEENDTFDGMDDIVERMAGYGISF